MNIVIYVGYYKNSWCPDDLGKTGLAGTEKTVIGLAQRLAEEHNVKVVGDVKNWSQGKLQFVHSDYYDFTTSIDILIGVAYIHFVKHFDSAKVNKKIFWLHNTEFYPFYKGDTLHPAECERLVKECDLIVGVSKWHRDYLIEHLPDSVSHKITYVYNGVDIPHVSMQKRRGSYIYASHPERGLQQSFDHYLTERKSGQTSFVVCTPEYGVEYIWNNHSDIITDKEVTYLGSLSSKSMSDWMSSTEFWLYDTDYEETFCLTAVEMLAHGVWPIVPNRPAALAEVLGNCDEESHQDELVEQAKKFSWDNIMKDWMDVLTMKPVVYVITINDNHKEIREKFTRLGLDAELIIKQGVRTQERNTDDWSVYDGWKIDTDNDWWNRPVTQGELGCSLSHFLVWNEIKKNRYPLALILEEDFVVNQPINEKMFAPLLDGRCQLLYFGRNALREEEEKEDGDYKICGPSYNTHAYALSFRGAEMLIEQNFQKNIIPVDEFLIGCYTDPLRSDISDFVWKDMTAYATKVEYVSQSSNRDNSTTEPSICDYQDWVVWCDRYLHPSALSKDYDLVLDEPITDVITFPLFNKRFCREIILLLNAQDKWVTGRHQYYPTVDVLLSSVGLDELYTKVLKEFVYPAAIHFWKLEGQRYPNLVPENFAIKYTPATQGHLNMHHDDGTFSTVLALNDEFTGGGTHFYRQGKTHKGEIGHIAIHPSQITHRHGGRPIEDGERYIIVSFCR